MNQKKKIDIVFKIILMLYLWVIAYAYSRLMESVLEAQSNKSMFITGASILCAIVGAVTLYVFKWYVVKSLVVKNKEE